MACSLVVMPPLVRPIRRPRCLIKASHSWLLFLVIRGSSFLSVTSYARTQTPPISDEKLIRWPAIALQCLALRAFGGPSFTSNLNGTKVLKIGGRDAGFLYRR